MREVIPKLRASITEELRYSYFVEAARCNLGVNPTIPYGFGRKAQIGTYAFEGGEWFFADPPKRMNPFEEKWHSPRDLKSLSTVETCYRLWPSLTRNPTSAFGAMINLLEVETIYWFSDFKDKVNENFVKTLCREMREKKIRLYLVSNSKKPHELYHSAKQKRGKAGAFGESLRCHHVQISISGNDSVSIFTKITSPHSSLLFRYLVLLRLYAEMSGGSYEKERVR